MTRRERGWSWVVFLGSLASMLMIAKLGTAADPICINPPATDQTQWDGQDGTLSYCTSNVPSAYDVSFDGIIDPAASVGPTAPLLTVIEFSVAGRVGVSTFTILPSEPTVPGVAGTAFFPPPLPPRILP